jgi:LytS/YehU family sensor histidine kinase
MTLDLLAELVHRDVPRAERLIARLADTLRLTLELGRESTTTIKQELDLLGACVEAHRIGVRPGVQLATRVSAEALALRIPGRLICTMVDDLLVADSANPLVPLTVRVEVDRVHDAVRILLRRETTWPDSRTELHAWWRKKSVAAAAVADAGPLVSLTFPDRATAVLMIADEPQQRLPAEDAPAVPAARSA